MKNTLITAISNDVLKKVKELPKDRAQLLLAKLISQALPNGSCKDWYCAGHNKGHK